MPELKLERKKVKVLKVDIEGKIYSVPLGTSLKRKELSELTTESAIMGFFEKHIGKEQMDDLSYGEIKQIVDAWTKETQEESGVSLGKS